jgi:hypothetical protein
LGSLLSGNAIRKKAPESSIRGLKSAKYSPSASILAQDPRSRWYDGPIFVRIMRWSSQDIEGRES